MRTLTVFALGAAMWAGASVAADNSPNWSSAAFMSGNQLYGHCQSEAMFSQGMCMGYVTALMDDIRATRALAHMPPCGPKEITIEQVQDVVMKYLRENPAERHYSAVSIAEYAISKAWCPSPSGSSSHK